jgi:PLP dependent protein
MREAMIAENIAILKRRIDFACKRSGRTSEEIHVLAVSKKSQADDIREAVKHGFGIFGESRIEAIEKWQGLQDLAVEKHMIGHLQTNKVKTAVEFFDVIQSLDSLKLAKEIDLRARNISKLMSVMIEVNVSGEEQKYGISPLEVEHFYDKVVKLTNLKVTGLMAMAPYVQPEETRPYFRQLKQINDILMLPNLSMGMTNDLEVAIEEGSNMIRIGTGIFGKE